MNECPHHNGPKYRECHHVGDKYVAVFWDDGFRDWICRSGTIGRRGSLSAYAHKELSYMLAKLHADDA